MLSRMAVISLLSKEGRGKDRGSVVCRASGILALPNHEINQSASKRSSEKEAKESGDVDHFWNVPFLDEIVQVDFLVGVTPGGVFPPASPCARFHRVKFTSSFALREPGASAVARASISLLRVVTILATCSAVRS